MKRLLILAALLVGTSVVGPLADTADACPMCKYANEDGSDDGAATTDAERRPKAYMYSILFMISMPATIFAGFSYSFYRMWRKQQDLQRVSLDAPFDPGA